MLNVCIYGYLTKFLTHNVGVCGKRYYLYDYINHLIDKVMRYSFETKANKIYANKVASYAEEDAAKIIPTKFSLDVEIEEKEILNSIVNNYQVYINKSCTKGIKYSIAGELFDLIAYKLRRDTLLLASYIRLNIIYNGNYVEITEKDFMQFSGLQKNCFYNAIEDAINNKIIARTTRKSIYVVNHNMIFKGNLYRPRGADWHHGGGGDAGGHGGRSIAAAQRLGAV